MYGPNLKVVSLPITTNFSLSETKTSWLLEKLYDVKIKNNLNWILTKEYKNHLTKLILSDHYISVCVF